MEVGSNVLFIISVLNFLPDGVSIQIPIDMVHALQTHQLEECSAGLSLFSDPILVCIGLGGLGLCAHDEIEHFVGVQDH